MMGMNILYYALAVLVIGVIILAFYSTVHSFRSKHRELDLKEMKLREKMHK